jgi:hypothetical protein
MTPTITAHDLDPRRLARIAGALYLVIIVCGLFSEVVVRGTLVVPGDAAATAANVVAADTLFRVGVVSDLVMLIADVAIAVALYVLLAPVSRALSALAAAFRLTQAAVLGLNLVHQLAAVLVLSNGGSLQAFDPGQLDALALLLLDVHAYGYLLGLTFFAGNLVVIGYLVYRSGFLPRTLGVLSMLAAAGYLADTLLFVLLPGYDGAVSELVLAPAFVAEIGFCAWLLIRGVDAAAWRRAAAGTRGGLDRSAVAHAGAAA